MKKGNHTPGPWTVGAPVFPTSCGIYGADRVVVARAVRGERDADTANARLIAAAPDLLAACEVVINDCRVFRGGPVGSTIVMIENAIAKARGTP